MSNDDSRTLESLRPADYNPRTMSPTDFDNLVNSMKKFGDLSGVVRNLQTDNLVGGHMRVEAFKRLPNPKVIIYHRNDDGPNAVGTVANGYIELDNGERFTYREVVWNEATERAANIAANRITGEFNLDQLAEVDTWLKKNAPELLGDTGQAIDEIDALLNSTGANGDTPPSSPDQLGKLMFKMDPTQAEVVRTALFKSRQNNSLEAGANTDAEALFLICRDYVDSQNEVT